MLSTIVIACLVGAPSEAEPKIVSASLFKNGYAVVVREVAIPESGLALVMEPRRAVLGTLWVTGAKGTLLQSVVSTTVEETQTRALESLDEVLMQNVGKVLTVTVVTAKGNETKELTGTVKASGGMLVMDISETGRIAVQKNFVIQITSPTGEFVFEKSGTATRRAIRISATSNGKALILSLERGLTWVPAYHVDVTDPKSLTLTSKATIVNDMDTIEDIDVRLITGFPNARFINSSDPMTSGESIDQFVNGMMQMGKSIADASPTSQVMSNRGMGGQREEFAFVPQGQLEGVQLEDLFFYTQRKVTLKKGERGAYLQFQEKAPFKHVYTLDLADTGWANFDANVRYPQPAPTVLPDVWHTLEFTNPSGSPLTTGTVTTFKEGEIIGQDMLEYTSPKSKGKVRITKALDVQAEVIEEETGRQIRALPATNYSNAYDLVAARGTIEITNHKTEDVAMKITKSLVGEVKAVSHGGNAKKHKGGLRSVNPNTEVSWDLTVKKGETIELTFDFEVYVPSR